jgi:bifunctional ADP-heptose synthase (sugar kinase/adenylyltransferase)
VRGCLKPNVDAKFFYRDDAPTIVKRRYINSYQKHKIFEVNYINDSYVDDTGIIKYLKDVIDGYDLVLISDFGHGIITADMIGALGGARKLAVNAQTNGANAGYNLITKYRNTGFICLDVSEARLAAQDKFSTIEDVAKKLIASIDCEKLMITVGGDGSICVNRNGEFVHTPAFATTVVDVVGAGDAFFAYTAPCFAMGMPTEMLSFIGNAVGALAVQIVGNKKPVEKHELLEFIHTIIK